MADTVTGSAPAVPASPAQPAPATAAPGSADSSSLQVGLGHPAGSAGESVGSGEPPRERWNDILDNARRKTRAEVEAEFQQRYAPYQVFERDPLSAVKEWLDQASQHSVYGPLVKQYFAERGKGPAASLGQEPGPDVPIVNEHGQVTGHTYSEKALKTWQAWNEARLKQELDGRFGQLERSNQERAERETFQALQYEAVQSAQDRLTSLRQQPYFKDHEPAIRQALVDHPEWGDNVHAAYTHVLVTNILPQLSQAEQRQAVTALTGKAAGTTVNPGGTAPAAPKFKSFRAAAEYYDQHPEEAAAMAKR